MSFPRGKGRGAKYGAAHQAERQRWLQRTTPATPCIRCFHPLGPAQRINAKGRRVGLWHLDHDEHGGYLGMSHGERCPVCRVKCNISAGAAKGARITNARRKPMTSRIWR